MEFYANLHTHSIHSDGVYTPERLVEIATQEGYRALAITDHDTATAFPLLQKACENKGMECVFGVEFTSPAPDVNASFHVVGFGFDPNEPAMKNYLEQMSAREADQTRVLFERGVAIGRITGITWDEVLEYNHGITWICNEHLFNAMKAKGLKTDHDYAEFFETLFGKHRFEVPPKYEFLPVDQMIALIHAAGGMAVVAHPHKQLRHMEYLYRKGLDGIEVWHPDLAAASERRAALETARKYDWFVSGGSDHSGLCGGQYERYENPETCAWYLPPRSVGTTEFFYREIQAMRRTVERREVIDAILAEEIL